MKLINKIEYSLYVLISGCIILVSYDVLNDLKIRNGLVNLFCNGTSGNCHFKAESIYGMFHYFGTYLSLIFGTSNFVFVCGQLLTLIIYLSFIWILLFVVKRISQLCEVS